MLVQQRINLCRNHSAHKTENGACSDDWSWEQEHRNTVRNRTESKQTRRTKNEGKEVGPSVFSRGSFLSPPGPAWTHEQQERRTGAAQGPCSSCRVPVSSRPVRGALV
jgi:hypothetical protein